jgi:hypothetical protein
MTDEDDKSIVWAHVTHVGSVNELMFVEAELRSHEIPYYIPERNTNAVYPQYMPPGGFSLLVRPEDVDSVRAMLVDKGVEIDREHEGSELLEWLDQWSRPLPFIGHMHIGKRLLVLGTVAALVYLLVVTVLIELQ